MVDKPAWPIYTTGPKESIFALGVVSVNFARLEHAVLSMFGTILGVDGELCRRLMFKIGPEMRDKLMREMLPTRQWPDNVTELAQHFINAHKICYENRNLLMHSNLMSGSEDAIVLYKTGRDGKSTLINPPLNELRQVADDMMVYFEFGMHLSNMINIDLLGLQAQPGDRWYREWPNKPPLPTPLKYVSETITINSMGF